MTSPRNSRKLLMGATVALTVCGLGASALPVSAADPTPYLVKDINTSGASRPTCLTEMGGVLYFAAKSVGRGTELWRSDGTALGTRRVKDINPGSGSSSPCDMAVVDGLLYFYARDGVHGHELWVSDGTNAGTRMIKDINPGNASSTPFFFTGANGLVFFSAEDAAAGRELWRTDGTEAGTKRVIDLTPGTEWSSVYPLGEYGGKLYFTSSSSNGDPEELILYRTDGTKSGTRPFRDKNGNLVRAVYNMVKLGSTMVFSGEFGTWRSLGTPATTKKIASVRAFNFIPFNGALYFSAPSGELWRTNGTKAGTVKIIRIVDEWGSAWIESNLVDLGGQLFFFANSRPWVSDGTTAGTQPLGSDYLNSDDGEIVALNGVAYFDSQGQENFDGCYDTEEGRPSFTPAPTTLLWSSDGTLAGTTNVDCRWAYMWDLTVVGNSIFYASDADSYGSELWRFVP